MKSKGASWICFMFLPKILLKKILGNEISLNFVNLAPSRLQQFIKSIFSTDLSNLRPLCYYQVSCVKFGIT